MYKTESQRKTHVVCVRTRLACSPRWRPAANCNMAGDVLGMRCGHVYGARARARAPSLVDQYK